MVDVACSWTCSLRGLVVWRGRRARPPAAGTCPAAIAGARVRVLGGRRGRRAEVRGHEVDAVRALIERHGARAALRRSPLCTACGAPAAGHGHRGQHPLAAGGEGEPRARVVGGASPRRHRSARCRARGRWRHRAPPSRGCRTRRTAAARAHRAPVPIGLSQPASGQTAVHRERARVDDGEAVLVLEVDVQRVPRRRRALTPACASSAMVPATSSLAASITVTLWPRPLKANTRCVARVVDDGVRSLAGGLDVLQARQRLRDRTPRWCWSRPALM